MSQIPITFKQAPSGRRSGEGAAAARRFLTWRAVFEVAPVFEDSKLPADPQQLSLDLAGPRPSGPGSQPSRNPDSRLAG